MSNESKHVSHAAALVTATSQALVLLKAKVPFHTAVGKAIKDHPTVGKREVIVQIAVKTAEARRRAQKQATA